MFEPIIDKGKDSRGYNHIKGIFDSIKLPDMFDYFYENNKGKNNPYHNNTHTFNVVELVNQYCIANDINDTLKMCYLVAALFHDFNHSGGKKTDKENVKLAYIGFWDAWQINRRNSFKTENTRILPMYADLIIRLINSTEFPYKSIEDNNSTRLYKAEALRVLREADILSYEHTEWEKYVYEGLMKENDKDANLHKDRWLIHMLDFHKKLLDSEIKTPFFIQFKEEHFPSFEKSVEIVKET